MRNTKARRYDWSEYDGMLPMEDGDYVTAEDYEKLEQQRDELMAAVGIFIYNRDVQKLFPEHCSAAGGVIEKIKAGVK